MKSDFFNSADLQLHCKDGSAVLATTALADVDYVLVYFSAHWCPPCREFTPLLKKFYEEHHETKKFEVVFISLDNSEEEMLEYFREAHGDYYCLSYQDAKFFAPEWSKLYSFETIPTLLVFDNARHPRKLVTSQGREMIDKDADAVGFPWRGTGAQPAAQTGVVGYLRSAAMILLVLYMLWFFLPKS